MAKSRVTAATAAEESGYQPDLLAEEEPRYLRRQKPVEIRRRKFARRSWAFYRRVLIVLGAALACGWVLFAAGRFFLYSPQVLLTSPEQIELTGGQMVGREAIVSKFYADRGKSVLRVPLDERRKAIEELPWVESASVQRILPNRVRVTITERTPVAFLRNGTELALIDARGVILDRPDGHDFQFPIVSGVQDSIPREERERRMQVFGEFMKDIELVRAGSSANVSEADLSNPKNLRVVMTGLAGPGSENQAVTVQFGSDNFVNKYEMLVKNFADWQAGHGRVQSIDLQYTRQVVINPEAGSAGAPPATAAAPQPPALKASAPKPTAKKQQAHRKKK